MKDEINKIFTQLVLILAEKGFVTLDVEYVDGTKIESKANKYTFVWRKTVEQNRAKLMKKTGVLLDQINDCIDSIHEAVLRAVRTLCLDRSGGFRLRFRHTGKDKVNMDFAFFAIAFNLKKMVAKSA